MILEVLLNTNAAEIQQPHGWMCESQEMRKEYNNIHSRLHRLTFLIFNMFRKEKSYSTEKIK